MRLTDRELHKFIEINRPSEKCSHSEQIRSRICQLVAIKQNADGGGVILGLAKMKLLESLHSRLILEHGSVFNGKCQHPSKFLFAVVDKFVGYFISSNGWEP